MRRALLSSLGLLVLTGIAANASGQQSTQTEFDKGGFQPNRDYLALQPFERIDTQSGNVIISLPMLTVPGNAGHDLDFRLTYNTNTTVTNDNEWSFGLAGVPMRILRIGEPPHPELIQDTVSDNEGTAPEYVLADGAKVPTVYTNTPGESVDWVTSANFWKFNRHAIQRRLYLPDGTVCTYDANGWLTDIVDIVERRIGMARRLMLLGMWMLIGVTPAAFAQPTDQVTYYFTDAIGSVRMTDTAGQIVRHDYLPFGEEWPQTPPGGTDKRLFAGKERDPETSFDYFGGRY